MQGFEGRFHAEEEGPQRRLMRALFRRSGASHARCG